MITRIILCAVLTFLFAGEVLAAPFAYIAHHWDTYLSVIDTTTKSEVARVTTGYRAYGVAANSSGTRVYVTGLANNALFVIDTATNTVIDTISLPYCDPIGVTVNPDGSRVYIASSACSKITVIDTASNTVMTSIDAGSHPFGLAVNPAGTRLYVANAYSDSVSVIDTAANAVTDTIAVGSLPYGVAMNPDGTRLYVANGNANTVSVIDTAINSVIATVDVGPSPVGLTVNPAGTKVYVANNGGNTVTVIDIATNAATASVTVGEGPHDIAFNLAGTRAYVVNIIGGAGALSVIDSATDTVIDTIPTGPDPAAFGGKFIAEKATTYYVPDNFGTIQAAINGVANGDTVLVRPGTYYENINFNGKAVTLRSTDGAVGTIIDGGNAGAVVSFASGEGGGSVLDGFTVTHGSNSGIYIYGGSPQVSNCIITGNSAYNGGGIYLFNSAASFTNCSIRGNSADWSGGGIYADSSYGTSYYSHIRNSSIMGNTAGTYGGGIAAWYWVHMVVTNCDIAGNSANAGGGVWVYYWSFFDADNCIISGNSATQGGGLNLNYRSVGWISNCTIAGNTASEGGGYWSPSDAAWTVLNNTIIYFNSTPPVIPSNNSFESPSYSHNDVEGGLPYGSGHIDADPMFVDAANGDFHLRAGSPCIDKGVSGGYSAPWDDKDGTPRSQGGVSDIGAYEYAFPDNDHDGFTAYADCNDADPLINPAAAEIYNNGIDDNCNGMQDEIDADHDNYPVTVDCNDNDASTHPGAAEVPYNGIDENCNGMADNDDLDGDGYGIAADCDDGNASIHHGAAEVPYNGIDENCNGIADDTDFDLDGYVYTNDCNDGNPAVNPGAVEIPYNSIDDNCNGIIDVEDLDNDGFDTTTDCDDRDPAVNPGAAEILYNGIDDNCNGIADDDQDNMPVWVASYYFNDSLAPDELGAPSLTAVDPLGMNHYDSTILYGKSRRVYTFDGNASPDQQAGLSLDTTGLLAPDNYSVEMMFKFTETPPYNRWRRILDVKGRMSDSGFYATDFNRLSVYPAGNQTYQSTLFTTNAFHHIVLSNDHGVVSVYLDGRLEFVTWPTTAMNINNPEDMLNFFLDDSSDSADGKVAFIRIYNRALAGTDVAALALNPFDDQDLDLDGYGIGNDCNDNDPTINPGATEIKDNGIDENCNGMADDDRDSLPLTVASYYFNDSLAAAEPNAPSLTAVDPLGMNHYESATLYGQARRVYSFDGYWSPADLEAGLSLDTTDLIAPDYYSVEMLFELSEARTDYWRRILDVEDRMSDLGFYVDNSNLLTIYGAAGYQTNPTTTLNTGEFHHIVLSNNHGIVSVYLDGKLELATKTTSAMNISNPGNILNFFLDNAAGPYQDESVDGKVALIRIYNAILTDSDVAALRRNLFDDEDVDLDGYGSATDCNNNNPLINPGANEIYNDGIDQNCNGMADDLDGDSDNSPAILDCNDSNPSIYPGAPEVPNDGIDQNCNGMADEYDRDLDGYPATNDCDDSNPAVHPGAPEDPSNGIDDNCNGIIDAEDLDHDGYTVAGDCNDQNASVHPNAQEINYDGIDQNCDGADGTIGIPLNKIAYTAITTGITDCDDASISGNIIAINADEGGQYADLNNDGDTDDYVLGYFDISLMRFISTGITDVRGSFTTDGRYIAFGRGTWQEQSLSYYDIETGTTHDTGLSITGLSQFKGVSGGKIVFARASADLNGDGWMGGPDSEIYIYDIATGSLNYTRIRGTDATISGNIVVFNSTRTGTIWCYNLSTGGFTDTGVSGDSPVVDGNFIAYASSEGLAYYNLSTGAAVVTPIQQYGTFSISRGVISFRADEGWYWGDLNGDGDLNDRDMLLYYDIENQRLVNTGVRGCCGGDISNGIMSIETYEDDIEVDLNGDGDMNDCVQQFVRIERAAVPVAVPGGPYWTGPNHSITLDGAGSYQADPAKSIQSWEWDLDGDGVFESAGQTVTAIWPEVGSYTVSLRVTDDSEPAQVDIATAVVAVAGTPAAAIPPGNGSPIYSNEPVTLSVDTSSHIVSYLWVSDRDGVISDQPTFSTSTLTVGTHIITCYVTDELGRTTTTTITVTILSQAARVDLALEWGDISFYQNGVEVTNPGILDPVVIKARIHNLSSEAISSSGTVYFYDYYATGNRWISLGEAQLPAIAPNGSATIELPWNPDPADPQAGYHAIQVFVSQDPSETFTSNNSATHHLVRGDRQAAGTAVIDVLNLNVSDQQQITTGTRIPVSGYAQYHWQNEYTFPVLGGKVIIRLGEQTYEARTDSNGWFSQEVVMPLAAGYYPLTVEVSDSTIVGRTQISLQAISITYSGPDLYVHNIYLANGVAEMPETVYAHIANRGGDIASGLFTNHIEIKDVDQQIVFTDTTTFVNTGGIGAGGGVTVAFAGWTPSRAGNYTITVSTDYNNGITESDENNNTTTINFYIHPHNFDIEVAELHQSCNLISARIINHGGLSSPAGTLHFADGAGDYSTVALPSIAGKGGYGVWINGAAYPGNQPDTVITVTAEVPGDVNSDNNSRSGTFDLSSKSDLAVSNLRVNDQSWLGGNTAYIFQPNTLQAEVKNLGCAPADGTLRFSIDGTPITVDPLPVPVIPGGGSVVLSITYDFADKTAGTDYTLAANAAISSSYTDAVPGNNSLAERLTVSPSLPDYRVYSEDIHFSIDPGHPARNEKFIISADIHNVGLWEGNAFQVAFYEEGQTLIGTVQTITTAIQPGGVLTVYPRDANGAIVDWGHGYSGNHAIMVTVAPEAGIQDDPNDADNFATRKVWVNYPPQTLVELTGVSTASRPGDTVSLSAATSHDNLDIDGKGGIARYDWDFGDGQTSPDAGPVVSHTYLAGGHYTAIVTVTDNNNESATASITAIMPYRITASAGAGGTITPSGDVYVSPGATQSFSIAAITGYHFAAVTGCGGTLDGSIYTTAAVTADCTVTTTFEINTYMIAAVAGPNGSITPAGDITVNYGGSRAFTITPDTGYNIADVLVDGVSVGTVSGYTFTNIIAGHTIFASFARGVSGSCAPTISPRSGLFQAAGGTGSITVNVDSQCGWTATSDSGWITVTNGSGTGNGTVTYSVSQNQTLERRVGTITISGQTFTVMQLR